MNIFYSKLDCPLAIWLKPNKISNEHKKTYFCHCFCWYLVDMPHFGVLCANQTSNNVQNGHHCRVKTQIQRQILIQTQMKCEWKYKYKKYKCN